MLISNFNVNFSITDTTGAKSPNLVIQKKQQSRQINGDNHGI